MKFFSRSGSFCTSAWPNRSPILVAAAFDRFFAGFQKICVLKQ